MHAGLTVQSAYGRRARAALLVGVPFFFLMGAMTLYVAFVGDDGVIAKAILSTVSCAFLAFALFASRLLPFLFSTIAAGPDGLRITGRSSVAILHPWSRISHFRNRQVLQVLDVYGKDGKRLLSVDYMIDNFDGLQRKLTELVSRQSG